MAALPPKILVFAGSTRTGSYNKKLARCAAELARAVGADVTHIDLHDLPMPLYDGDLEAEHGVPEHGRIFKSLLKAHDGFLISSPEYNSSISGVLKNAIDWASRQEPGERPLECFVGKVAALVSASPGALGGLRGLTTLRSILNNIGVLVLPDQLAVSKANDAFANGGSLKDDKQKSSLKKLVADLAEILSKLRTHE